MNFSDIVSQWKLNKYHFIVCHNHTYLNEIHKKVITVIDASTNVVFKSLLKGLRYESIVGDTDAHAQSIINPNMLPNSIIQKIHQINGKNFLEKLLSSNESLIYESKVHTKCNTADFNFEVGFFNALFAKIEKIKTIIKNAKVAIFVLLIGQYTCSHCIFGICGHSCVVSAWVSTSVTVLSIFFSVIFFIFRNIIKLII